MPAPPANKSQMNLHPIIAQLPWNYHSHLVNLNSF